MSIEQRIFELNSSIYCPQLRSGIDFTSTKQNGIQYIVLYDTLDISDTELLITQDYAYLLQFFDGSHSKKDIWEIYKKSFDENVPETKIQEFIKHLDQSFMLNSLQFSQELQRIKSEYRQLPERLPSCAGSSYPSNAVELESFLDDLFKNTNSTFIQPFDKSPKAIIAPHIDLQLGAKSFVHAYHCLKDKSGADLYIVFGIGHMGLKNLFALTEKDFKTPLGTVKTDKNLVKQISSSSQTDFMDDEFVHKNEHSIEFQTVFLKYLNPDAKILPVLCSFSPMIFEKGFEHYKLIFNDFVTSLKQALSTYKGRVCYIASADFAHVGQNYDNTHNVDKSFLTRMKANDNALIQSLIGWDNERFQEIIQSTNDFYHICGYSAITTLLELLTPESGHLVDYQTADMGNNSFVSFSSLVFY